MTLADLLDTARQYGCQIDIVDGFYLITHPQWPSGPFVTVSQRNPNARVSQEFVNQVEEFRGGP